MFTIFAENKLTVINTNASSKKVLDWKNSAVVAECHKKLFEPSSNYMNRILDKVYGTDLSKRSDVQVAFAVVLVEYILNSRKERIKAAEELLERRIEKYLVCFQNHKYAKIYATL
jgi:hypothetical protein